MPIIASKGSNFTPCPAGSHIAICCDVVDLGIIKSEYAGKPKSQHKIKIIWEIDEKTDDGKPFRPQKRYTLSLHEKAALRKDLESWRGRSFTDEELEGFDLENLIGIGCMLSVVHVPKNGTVYSNVTAIMRPPKGVQPPSIDPSYVRVHERPIEGASVGSANDDHNDFEASDSDVPF